jgi:hypothetical protein
MPEAYALNLCFLGSALVLCVDHARTPDMRRVALLGLVLGLGVTQHALWRPWSLVFVAQLLITTPAGQRIRAAVVAVLFACAGLLAWAWLPAAALSDASHAWGQPDSMARLWDHINASSIRRGHEGAMWPGPYAAMVHLQTMATQLWRGLAVLAPAGVVAGLLLVVRDRRTALVVLGIAAADGVYSAWINPMGLVDVQNGQALAVALAVAAGVGIGDSVAGTRFGNRGSDRVTGLCTALLLLVVLIPAQPGPYADLSRDRSSEDVVFAHLHAADPDSVTTWGSDFLAASGLYARVVCDARPDMWTIGRWALSDPAIAESRAADAPFAVAPPGLATPSTDESLNVWMRAVLSTSLGRRSVYHEVAGRDADLPGGVWLEHRWPVGAVRIGDQQVVTACEPAAFALCGPHNDAAFGVTARRVSGAEGIWYSRWLAAQWGRTGNACVQAGDFACAEDAFARAHAIADDRAAYVNGLALVLASTGRLESALEQIDVALRLDPLNRVAIRNGALYAAAMGDGDQFERFARMAERLGVALPDDARRPR